MLKLGDIQIEVGRAVGGDFMRVIHVPTGIFRIKGPPLNNPGKTKREMLHEIEDELLERGFAQHIILDQD